MTQKRPALLPRKALMLVLAAVAATRAAGGGLQERCATQECVVSGAVFDENGVPLAGIRIRAVGCNLETCKDATDQQGTYELRVPRHLLPVAVRYDTTATGSRVVGPLVGDNKINLVLINKRDVHYSEQLLEQFTAGTRLELSSDSEDTKRRAVYARELHQFIADLPDVHKAAARTIHADYDHADYDRERNAAPAAKSGFWILPDGFP